MDYILFKDEAGYPKVWGVIEAISDPDAETERARHAGLELLSVTAFKARYSKPATVAEVAIAYCHKGAHLSGRKGGLSRSKRKARSARENGKKGGRPRKTTGK